MADDPTILSSEMYEVLDKWMDYTAQKFGHETWLGVFHKTNPEASKCLKAPVEYQVFVGLAKLWVAYSDLAGFEKSNLWQQIMLKRWAQEFGFRTINEAIESYEEN